MFYIVIGHRRLDVVGVVSGTVLTGTTDSWSTLVVLVRVVAVRVRVGSRSLLLFEEVLVRDGWEGGGLVNDRSVVDLLVDSSGVVDSGWLDGLLLDDWLDCQDVREGHREVVDVTHQSRGCGGARARRRTDQRGQPIAQSGWWSGCSGKRFAARVAWPGALGACPP